MLFNPDDVAESSKKTTSYAHGAKGYRNFVNRTPGPTFPTTPITTTVFRPAGSSPSHHSTTQPIPFGQVDPERLLALADAPPVSSSWLLLISTTMTTRASHLRGSQWPPDAPSAIDLVKKPSVPPGELAEDDVERLYDQYWARFDGWWKGYGRAGIAPSEADDVLLSVADGCHGGLKPQSTSIAGGPRISQTKAPAPKMLKPAYCRRHAHIGSKAREYRRLPSRVRTIRALDITTAVPLFAWLRTPPSSALAHFDHVRAVREPWSRGRCTARTTGQTGRCISRVFREASRPRKRDTPTVIDGSVLRPANQDVEDAFNPAVLCHDAARIRLLLGAIDHLLRSEDPMNRSAVINYNDLQIEHIMPQSGRIGPSSDADGNQLQRMKPTRCGLTSAPERRRAVDRIGNFHVGDRKPMAASRTSVGWKAPGVRSEVPRHQLRGCATEGLSERSIEECAKIPQPARFDCGQPRNRWCLPEQCQACLPDLPTLAGLLFRRVATQLEHAQPRTQAWGSMSARWGQRGLADIFARVE